MVSTWSSEFPNTRSINLAMQKRIIWNWISCKNKTTIQDKMCSSIVNQADLESETVGSKLYHSGYKELEFEKLHALCQTQKVSPATPDPKEEYVVIVDTFNLLIQKQFQDRSMEFTKVKW